MAPASNCAPVEWRFAQRTGGGRADHEYNHAGCHDRTGYRLKRGHQHFGSSVQVQTHSERFSNQTAASARAPAAKAAAHQIMATLGTDAGENGVINTWDMTGGCST